MHLRRSTRDGTYVIVQRAFCGGNCHLIPTKPYVVLAWTLILLRDIHHLQTIAYHEAPCLQTQ